MTLGRVHRSEQKQGPSEPGIHLKVTTLVITPCDGGGKVATVSTQACKLGRELAAAIKAAAGAQHLDHIDVAHMFGVKPHYVRRLFRGDVTASVAQLQTYATLLGYEIVVGIRLIDQEQNAP